MGRELITTGWKPVPPGIIGSKFKIITHALRLTRRFALPFKNGHWELNCYLLKFDFLMKKSLLYPLKNNLAIR